MRHRSRRPCRPASRGAEEAQVDVGVVADGVPVAGRAEEGAEGDPALEAAVLAHHPRISLALSVMASTTPRVATGLEGPLDQAPLVDHDRRALRVHQTDPLAAVPNCRSSAKMLLPSGDDPGPRPGRRASASSAWATSRSPGRGRLSTETDQPRQPSKWTSAEPSKPRGRWSPSSSTRCTLAFIDTPPLLPDCSIWAAGTLLHGEARGDHRVVRRPPHLGALVDHGVVEGATGRRSSRPASLPAGGMHEPLSRRPRPR